MKRSSVIAAFLLVISLAFAQGRPFVEAMSAGMSITPAFGLGANVSVGAKGLVGPMDLRSNVQLAIASGVTSLSVGSDLLYPLPLEEALQMDVGLGSGIMLVGGGSIFYLRALAGVELPVQSYLSVRVEPTLSFYNLETAAFDVRIGPRVYLK